MVRQSCLPFAPGPGSPSIIYTGWPEPGPENITFLRLAFEVFRQKIVIFVTEH